MSDRARPTIKDVAEAAGVAVGTVSRVINCSGSVKMQTAERVRAVIAEMGFRPNASGRALRLGESGAIGVLVPTISNPIFARSLEGIEQAGAAFGFSTIVTTSRYDPARELDQVAALAARGVQGLILTLADTTTARIAAVAAHGLPFVLVYNPPGAEPGTTPYALATVDSHAAVREAAQQLISLGHRRIAFLGGSFSASDRAKARYQGYCEAMAAQGLPAWRAVELSFSADTQAFETEIAALLKRLAPPTAIICSNDLLALQAIAAARHLGLSVPDDLSVIGFDGMPMGQLVHPQLATVKQPALSMGASAADLLFGMIRGDAPRHMILPHEFRPGGTLAAARMDVDPMRAGSTTQQSDRSQP